MKNYLVLPCALAWIENKNSDILIGRQTDLPGKPYPGKWDLPGGKISPGEEPKKCAIREIKEETGFDVTKIELMGVYHSRGHDTATKLSALILCYKAKVIGELVPDELEDMQFVPKEKLSQLDLTPWLAYFLREYL